MYSIEVQLPIITMLIRIKMAAPGIRELEDGPEAYPLEEVEHMLPSRSLREPPSEFFEFRFVQ